MPHTHLLTQLTYTITRLTFLRERTKYTCDWATIYPLKPYNTHTVPSTVLTSDDTMNDTPP